MSDKKKRSLLLFVGLVLVLAFAVSTILDALQINRNYSNLEMEKMQAQAKQITDYVANELYSYKALPWLLDYWENNHESMDIPAFGMEDEEWIARHDYYFNYRVKNVSVDEAEALSGEKQKNFAEVCYMKAAFFFDSLKQQFKLVGINASMYRGDEEAFLFFYGLDEGDETLRYSLGKMWPLHLDLHPVAEKIYKTGEDISEIEHAVSTTDGIDYMFVYTPIIVQGKLRMLICETLHWTEVENEIIANVQKIEIANSICLLLVDLLLMFILTRVVIRPLSDMQGSVHSYRNTKDSSVIKSKLGDLSERSSEIGFLASDVIDLAEEIDRYIEDVRSATMENERISTELSLAAKIQTDVLPDAFSAFPERKEFDLYASMTPAKEVGGDFYDFFLIDDDHLALVMADVSGKGIPAAMFMMFCKNVVANNVAIGKSPEAALTNANKTICANNSKNMFVTVWLGILEISTGRMTCANAGHEYPVLKQGDRFELFEDKHGIPLGFLDMAKYEEYVLELKPGDKLFVYTDGVPEATASDMEMFGTDRMVEALNHNTDASPKKMLENVENAVVAFVKEAEQFDDLTMLAIEYRGDAAPSGDGEKATINNEGGLLCLS